MSKPIVWQVVLLKRLGWNSPYPDDYFPRKFYYKKDAVKLCKEVMSKGGSAVVKPARANPPEQPPKSQAKEFDRVSGLTPGGSCREAQSPEAISAAERVAQAGLKTVLKYSQGSLVNSMGYPYVNLSGCSVGFAQELAKRWNDRNDLLAALQLLVNESWEIGQLLREIWPDNGTAIAKRQRLDIALAKARAAIARAEAK